MKKIYAFLAACLLSVSAAWADYKIVYTVFDEATGTLTYYYDYDSKRKEVNGKIYDIENVRFDGYAKDIIKVHIHQTMRDCYLLKSTRWMFFSGDYSQTLSNLTEITGMQNLHTEDVKDMSEMFYGCSALTSIDVSQLDTRSVINMDCMFQNCSSLESLDLSYFWTHNVEQMSYMFDGCKALKSVNLANFRTENVQWMDGMFYDCESLTELDIANFDMRKVTTVSSMFGKCSCLQTIYCNNNWNTIGMDADDLFEGCVGIVGGYGTTYDPDHTYIDYARPETGSGNKGYFTFKSETFAYFDENTGTLWFMTGTGRQILPTAELVPIQIVDDEMQQFYQTQVKKLLFDEGMQSSTLTQAKDLLTRTVEHVVLPYSAVEHIDGLENINTSVMTSWELMFYGMSIKEIDLTKIDMAPITDITNLFWKCKELETIYCNDDWNERDDWKIWVGDGSMFRGCEKLRGGNGTMYDEEHQGFSYAHPDVPGNPGYFTATKTALEDVQVDKSCAKIFRDGQLLIVMPDGKTFNAFGTEIR